jgi:hypothetical protein
VDVDRAGCRPVEAEQVVVGGHRSVNLTQSEAAAPPARRA